MYDTLGLKNEFERGVDGTSVDGWKNDYGGAQAAMECEDNDDHVLLFDMNNQVMRLESTYSSMKKFRLSMIQYAINGKFELGIKATSTWRYRGYWKGGDCPWSIHARKEEESPTIIL